MKGQVRQLLLCFAINFVSSGGGDLRKFSVKKKIASFI